MNAQTILDQLNAREIAERLEQIDAERKALLTLLRAAKQRERGQKSAKPQQANEGQR